MVYELSEPKIGSGRCTVGKCTGPKWSEMAQTTILVKRPYSEPDFSIRETKIDKMVHFWSLSASRGPFLVHLGPPTVFWPFLIREQQNKYHSQDCTGDVHRGFCGGGARVVGFEPSFDWPRNPNWGSPTIAAEIIT